MPPHTHCGLAPFELYQFLRPPYGVGTAMTLEGLGRGEDPKTQIALIFVLALFSLAPVQFILALASCMLLLAYFTLAF